MARRGSSARRRDTCTIETKKKRRGSATPACEIGEEKSETHVRGTPPRRGPTRPARCLPASNADAHKLLGSPLLRHKRNVRNDPRRQSKAYHPINPPAHPPAIWARAPGRGSALMRRAWPRTSEAGGECQMCARAWAIIGGARPGDAPSGTSKSGLKRRRGKKMPFSAIAAREHRSRGS